MDQSEASRVASRAAAPGERAGQSSWPRTEHEAREFGRLGFNEPSSAVISEERRVTMYKRIMQMLGVVTGLVILGGCATAPSSQEGRAALTRDVGTALAKAKVQDPELQGFLDKAYGYAIFPSVGKGAVGVGGAYGKGEVFERGKQIGYCDMTQATIGLALGGQAFTEIIVTTLWLHCRAHSTASCAKTKGSDLGGPNLGRNACPPN